MTPNNKPVFPFVSFFLVLMTIACTISSSVSSTSAAPTVSSGGSTPGGKGPEVASPTAASAVSSVAAGQAGAPFIEQVSNQTKVPGGQSGMVSAACPKDSLALGGGFESGAGMKITKTMPGTDGWVVSGRNSSAGELSLTVHAACMHNAAGTVRVESANMPVSGAPFANCQPGEIVTGGGYGFDTNSLEVYISTPIGDSVAPHNSWSVMAHHLQSPDEPITVYAVCLSKSDLKSVLVRDQTNFVPGKDSLSFTLVCPAGAVMVEGGYEGTGAYINRVNAADASVWEVQVEGKYFYDGSLDHAVCLRMP
jgi:hypothetical protein